MHQNVVVDESRNGIGRGWFRSDPNRSLCLGIDGHEDEAVPALVGGTSTDKATGGEGMHFPSSYDERPAWGTQLAMVTGADRCGDVNAYPWPLVYDTRHSSSR